MSDRKSRVCPVKGAFFLVSGIRRWLQDPRKILAPYVREGMTVLDIGCGPGFFSIDMAEMVGASGRVIACDLQEGMLEKLKGRIAGTGLEERITLHKCEADKLGVTESCDFVLAFYVVHEIPDEGGLFKEIASILKPGGQVLLVEPPFHVSKAEFEETLKTARDAGLTASGGPKVFFGRTAVLEKGGPPLAGKL